MAKNVLVVEKDFDSARRIAKALEAEGFFVFTASSAEAGLVMARRVKPSLVLLGLPAGEAAGIEFMDRLRHKEHMPAVPVLVIAEDEQYDPRLREIYGIAGLIKTPLDDGDIVARSRAALNGVAGGARQAAGSAFRRASDAAPRKDILYRADEFGPGDGDIVRLSDDPSNAGAYAAESLYRSEEGADGVIAREEGKEPGAMEWEPPEVEDAPPPAFGGGGQDSWALPEDEKVGEDEAPGISGGQDAGENVPHAAAGEAVTEAAASSGFEAPLPLFKGEGKNLPGEGGKNIEDKEGAPVNMEKEDDMGEEEAREERQAEDDMPSFRRRTKIEGKQGAGKKNLVLVLLIVLLGAAASFVFLGYLGKRKPLSRMARSQPPVMKQNAPAFVAVPAVPVNAAAVNAATAKVPSARSAAAGRSAPANTPKVSAASPALSAKAGKMKLKAPARHTARHKAAVSRSGGIRPLQVGAFSVRAHATKLEGKLRSEGFHAYIVRVSENGHKPLYRVLVGRFKSRGDKRAAFERLKKDGFKPFRLPRPAVIRN